ncbi:MAG: UDP-N-acetylglucosamine 2-epimerase [Gammaproteobacteria bacterium]
MRKIVYLSGTRADFGLMRQTLLTLQDAPEFDVSVAAVGMHLDPDYGMTVEDIERSGLPICARVPLDFSVTNGAAMARGVGELTIALTDVFERERPWLVLLLGDRGEMLAGAIAAVHLNLPIAHIHGGERSGTVDESVRHAISKLAHFHFTTTPGARERLLRMGERPETVSVSGAPGLDKLGELELKSRAALCASLGFDAQLPLALFLYHPDLYDPGAADFMLPMVATLERAGVQMLILKPNADAGSERIRARIEEVADHPAVRVVTHLERSAYLSWMAAADVLVGNSSSGIIEAASFDTPVINVGQRQRLRERNANVADVDHDLTLFEQALKQALTHQRSAQPSNIYGDGRAAEHICTRLQQLEIEPHHLSKVNAH